MVEGEFDTMCEMKSKSSQFVPSRRMGLYEPIQQVETWLDFKRNNCFEISHSILDGDVKLDNQSESNSCGKNDPSNKYNGGSKPNTKVLKRLAQNREAARKSRQRKKAYVQELENSKLRLLHLEEEVVRSRQQGVYIDGGLDSNLPGCSGTINPGISTFELEYGRWVEEHDQQISDLRNCLNSGAGDMDLSILVDNSIKHYFNLFAMKATAAKADVFYILSGIWKTSAERVFFWIGGFRPSEFLKVLLPNLEPLEEQQRREISHLAQSCQQAEEALTQGISKLHQIAAETIAAGLLVEENYLPQIDSAIERLEALVRFVRQADHLRQETLEQMFRILSTSQAARGLLALGEYLQRFRVLSSVWESRSIKPANGASRQY